MVRGNCVVGLAAALLGRVGGTDERPPLLSRDLLVATIDADEVLRWDIDDWPTKPCPGSDADADADADAMPLTGPWRRCGGIGGNVRCSGVWTCHVPEG